MEEQRRLNLGREQVLARLWEIANLSPEMTRGSITGQVKALSMIVAIEGLIPDRRAVPAQNKSAPLPVNAQIYQAAWLAGQQRETADPQPGPELAQEEDDPPACRAPARPAVPPAPPVPACRGAAPWKPTPGLAGDVPPTPGPVFDPSESAFANRFKPVGSDAIVALCPRARFCSRQTSPFLDRKESLYLAPETLRETDALPMPRKDQKGSNFIEFYKK